MTQAQASKIGFVMLENVRIAFVEDTNGYGGLWTPSKPDGGGRPSYSSTALFPPTHPCVAKIQKAMVDVARAKWGPEGDKVLQALIAGGRICLHDGNAKPNLAGFPGNYYVTARTPVLPLVIDQNRQPIVQSSGVLYSGCYVNMSIAIWAQQNKNGQRMNAQLRGVQKVKDGEPFSGGDPANVDEFGDIEASAQAAAEFGSLFGGAPAQANGAGQAPAAQSNDFNALLGLN